MRHPVSERESVAPSLGEGCQLHRHRRRVTDERTQHAEADPDRGRGLGDCGRDGEDPPSEVLLGDPDRPEPAQFRRLGHRHDLIHCPAIVQADVEAWGGSGGHGLVMRVSPPIMTRLIL